MLWQVVVLLFVGTLQRFDTATVGHIVIFLPRHLGVHPYIVFAVETGVLDKDASTGPKIQVSVGGEEAAVEEVEGLEDDKGTDEGGLGSVVVGGKDGRQASRKTILNDTERKVRVRANANCLATRDKVGDPEVVGELAVLWDNADVMDGGEPEWLGGGKQRGMVDEGRDGGDFNRKPGCYFVPRSVLGTTDDVDADILVGMLVVLVNARGVREDDGRRDILLVIKMGERRQWTG
jgi:hypothetical protein